MFAFRRQLQLFPNRLWYYRVRCAAIDQKSQGCVSFVMADFSVDKGETHLRFRTARDNCRVYSFPLMPCRLAPTASARQCGVRSKRLLQADRIMRKLLLRFDRAGFLLQGERFVEVVVVELAGIAELAICDAGKNETDENRSAAAGP